MNRRSLRELTSVPAGFFVKKCKLKKLVYKHLMYGKNKLTSKTKNRIFADNMIYYIVIKYRIFIDFIGGW